MLNIYLVNMSQKRKIAQIQLLLRIQIILFPYFIFILLQNTYKGPNPSSSHITFIDPNDCNQYHSFQLLFSNKMKAIDIQTYQTLNRTLILQQQHPFQPHQVPSPKGYKSKKKTMVKTAMDDHLAPNCDQQCAVGFEKKAVQLQNLYLSAAIQRFNTDDIQKQLQPFIIHPYKQQPQPNQPCNHITGTLPKQAYNGPSDRRKTNLKENNSLKIQDLFQRSQNMPTKKQDYFHDIGGFNHFYKPIQQKCKQIPSKRYPILFVSNLSLILSLFLALRLNDYTMWIIQCGIAIIYFLTVYYNEVRVMVFTIRKMEQLQTTLNDLKKINGYFLFFIQCFHYHHCKNGDEKIITYRKSEKLVPQSSKDESVSMSEIEVKAKFIDLSLKKQFYFEDKEKEVEFATCFNTFVEKNKRDIHQKYGYKFQIQQLVGMRGFFSRESNHLFIVLFIICGVIGLIFPFAIWFQNNIHRYEASIIKKITLQ